MPFARLLLLAALVLPASLSAQGQRGNMPDPRDFELRTRDLTELGTARLFVAYTKDLQLDGAQLVKLDELRKAYDADAKRWAGEANRHQRVLFNAPPTFRRSDDKPATKKDSVERAHKDSVNQAKYDAWAETQAKARRDLTDALLRIRVDYDATVTAATAVLTDVQREKVKTLLQIASDALSTRLRQANIR